MNIKENIENLKMDKKTFKKLSKSKAYDGAYMEMYEIAVDMVDNVENAHKALKLMEEAKDNALESADAAMASAEHSKKAADKAVEWALDAENRASESKKEAAECAAKYKEAKAFTDEAILGVSLITDQIKKVTAEKSEAERLKQKSDSEFVELMADTLNKKSLNQALSKLSFNAADNSAEDLEALKVVSRAIENEMSENNRQIALNKASMEAIKSNSVKADKTVKSKDLELKLLEEDYNNALRTIGELVVNGGLKL